MRERGFALVAVLATLALVAALALAALAFARAGAASGTVHAADVEGGAAAEAGLRLAALRLADVEDAADGGPPPPLAWLGWRVAVGIEDEGAKIDLNRAPADVVSAGLSRFGLAGPPARRSRFVAVDDLAGALDLPAERLPALRRAFTVYGGDGGRGAGLQTYRLVATARRGRRAVTRWAIVRLSPGFGEPFEWLERGADGDVTGLPPILPES